MSFRAIREHNAEGVLVAAGYEWAEQKDGPGILLFLLTSAGVVAALGGLWVALVGTASIGLPIIFAGVLVAWWGRRWMRTQGQVKRSLVFLTDDTIVAPHGLAGSPIPESMPIRFSEISNLAFRLDYDTPYITLITKDGRSVDVISGRNLTDDEGSLIHTELSLAREETRQAMARQVAPA